MATVKTLKGKISRTEWPAILSRHEGGETFAGIARSYGCTAPAIRYIVTRERNRRIPRSQRERSRAVRGVIEERGPAPLDAGRGGASSGSARNERDGGSLVSGALHARITRDVAAFLGALDLLTTRDSPANRARLRDATDRLLRAAARTLIELERESVHAAGNGVRTG